MDPNPVVMDGDGLGLNLKFNAPLSPGFSFVLTPHHPESVSMKSKYCSKANGEEVLVITRRDSYYLLTAIQNTPSFECTFEIQTFYVLNNPVYSLILTSPSSSPIIVDWTTSMYEGELAISMKKSDTVIDSLVTTSTLSLSLDTKSQTIKTMYVPLTFALEYDFYLEYIVGPKFDVLNKFMTVFNDCVDSKGKVVAKFHVQRINSSFTFSSDRYITETVLVEILEPSSLNPIYVLKCEASVRHYITPEITVKLDFERYSTGSLNITSSLAPNEATSVNTYSASLGRLKMNASVNKMLDWVPHFFSTVTGILTGRGLYSEVSVWVHPDRYTCVVVKGLESTVDEVFHNTRYDQNNPSPTYERSYDATLDLWTVQLLSTSYEIVSIISTSLTAFTHVTWTTCEEFSANPNTLFNPIIIRYKELNPSELDLADIRIYSPSAMTVNSPITIELKSIIAFSYLSLNVKLPYISPLPHYVYSECKAYNSTDRLEIDVNPDAYFKTSVSNSVVFSGNGNHLSLQLASLPYYKFIKCEIFGHFIDFTVDPASLSGDNAEVSIGMEDFPIKLNPNNVRFEKYEVENIQGLSTNVTVTPSMSTEGSGMSIQSTQVSLVSSRGSMSVQSTPSLQIHTLRGSGYHVEMTRIPVTISQVNGDVIGQFIYAGEFDTSLISYFSVVMASLGTGFVIYDKTEPFEDIFYTYLNITNHPDAVQAFNQGQISVELDFTLYIKSPLSYFNHSNKLFSVYTIDKEFGAQTHFPTLPPVDITFIAKNGRSRYLTTHELLMKSILNNDNLDSVPVTIKVKSKYVIDSLQINMITGHYGYMSYFDYFKDVTVSFGVIPEINNIQYEFQVNQGEINFYFINEMREYDEDVETTITFTTFINLPNIIVKYSTPYHTDFFTYTEGVSGLASVVGLPDVISSGFVLDTSNLNFNYTDINTKTTLELALPDLWTTHYYTNNEVVCPVDNFNIFKWNSAEKNSQGEIVFSEVDSPITLANIPTHHYYINLPITYTVDSTVKNSPRDIQTFTPLVYLPDFSHITNIARVDDTGLPQLDTPITPDSDFIAFSITGYVFSPVSKLMINIYQLPIRPVKCMQRDTIKPITDVYTIAYLVERDFSNSNPFDYQEFTVTCEFVYRPTAEMRKGRYTGVMKATLESPTLGQSSTTFVNKGFEVVLPTINSTDTDGKDTVTVNSQMIVRDTPATGLTSTEIDSLLDKYKEATNSVSGTDNNEVFIDDVKTYPVGENKYDTDVNIVIVPPETDSSLSLKDVQDINDKFVLDLDDSWEVSVAPPTYSVEVDECKGKCGVGCRLCRNGNVCTVDGDCLFKHCDSKTNQCTVVLDTDTNTDNDNGSHSTNICIQLSISVLALLSILFI